MNKNLLFSLWLTFLTLFSSVAWGQVNLPYNYDNGKSGLNHSGLGADYSNSPKLRFDDTGDYLIVNFNDIPEKLTFNAKLNGSSSNSNDFQVQVSSDGINYQFLGQIFPLNSSQEKSYTFDLSQDIRYIKWIYIKKSSGNIGLGKIGITKLTQTNPSIQTNLASITNFSTYTGTASTTQSFNLTGSNLDGTDVVITAPAGFEISETASGTYDETITLAAPTSFANKAIYARLKADNTIGEKSGNITVIGGGIAAALEISVSGQVLALPDAPILTPAQTFSTIFGSGGTYQVASTGGPIISWSPIEGLGNGITFSNGTFAIANTVNAGVYTYDVTASNVTASSSTTVTLNVNPAEQVFPTFENKSEVIDDEIELPQFLKHSTLSDLDTSTIIYTSSNEALVQVVGNKLHLRGATPIESPVTITATSSNNNENYTPNTAEKSFTVTVKKKAQTISGLEAIEELLGVSPITLTGNSTSNQPLVYTIFDGEATDVVSIENNIVTILKVGTTKIKAFAPETLVYKENEVIIDVTILDPNTIPCFSEDFNTVGGTTSTSGSGNSWNGNGNFTATKVYQGGQAIRVGTSDPGKITSKPNVLRNVEGDVRVELMVKGWTTVEGNITITLNGESKTFNYTANLANPYEKITATFDAVPANSTLEIEMSKRGFIDDIKLFCTKKSTLEIESAFTSFSAYETRNSAVQSFKIKGRNLIESEDVHVVAPNGYEIKLKGTDDATYAQEKIIENVTATLAETEFEIRLKNSLNVGTYSGDIKVYGAGVDEEESTLIPVTGNVASLPAIPVFTTTATDFTATYKSNFTAQVNASGTDLNYSLVDVSPEINELTINVTTGELTGNFSTVNEEGYTFKVKVKDIADQEVVKDFTLIVNKADQVLLESLQNIEGTVDDEITLPQYLFHSNDNNIVANTIKYTSANNNIVEVNDYVLKLKELTTEPIIITALVEVNDENYNSNYNNFGPVSFEVVVGKKLQTLEFQESFNLYIDGEPLQLPLQSTQGINFNYSLSEDGIVSIVNTQVSGVTAGTVVLTLSNDGNEVYAPFTKTVTLNVLKSNQLIEGLKEYYLGDLYGQIILPNVTNKGNQVIYTSTDSRITIVGNKILLNGEGTVDVNIYVAENDSYNKIEVTRQINIINPSINTNTLIISQVYEGTSNNKWLELTNIGDRSLDLFRHKVVLWNISNDSGNGNITGDYTYQLKLYGILEPGQSLLIRNSQASLEIPHSSMPEDAITGTNVANFNGNDAVAILDLNDNILDAFGHGINNKDKSYHRLSTVNRPNPQFTISEWKQEALNSIASVTADNDTKRIGVHIVDELVHIVEPTIAIWENGSWKEDLAPTASIDAVILSNLTEGFAAKKVYATRDVVVPTGVTINVEDNVEVRNGGSLTFEPESYLIQNSNERNIGNVTYKAQSKAMYRNDMSIWSSPVQGQKIRAFSPETLVNRFWWYDEPTTNYLPLFIEDPTDVDFEPAKGIAIRVRNTLPTGSTEAKIGAFTGVLNNGNYSISATKTVNGYNLVGNPYPSNIDVDKFFLMNPKVEKIFIWTPHYRTSDDLFGNNYITINKTGASGIVEGDIRTIAAGQGFFVQVTDGTTILFDNSLRTAGAGTFQRRENNRYWLSLTKNGVTTNRILVDHRDGATIEEDHQYDAKSIEEGATKVYTKIGDDNYSIQSRPFPLVENERIPLGITTNTASEMTIALENAEGIFASSQEVFIEDKELNVIHNLSASPYVFTANVGVVDNRFEIIYSDRTLATTDVVVKGVKVYQNGSKTIIETDNVLQTVNVYDALGRQILVQKNINSNKTEFHLSKGVYYLSIELDNQTKVSEKVLIK